MLSEEEVALEQHQQAVAALGLAQVDLAQVRQGQPEAEPAVQRDIATGGEDDRRLLVRHQRVRAVAL